MALFEIIGIVTVTIILLFLAIIAYYLLSAFVVAADRFRWHLLCAAGPIKATHWWSLFKFFWGEVFIESLTKEIEVTSGSDENWAWWGGFGNWHIMRNGVFVKKGFRYGKD